ncbi:dead deah box helicase domain-containing protein [Cyclospora cayetanensis]|uniref:Dead deah box helicase domain-containing protein n=1 Tax=Cyclospora cayetanensis TaxID=88456 RepID=A0A1D3D270_9EIME|nr:dead deah box helicase domain-containing protein [Cyclospora cayetanensis]
MPRAHAHHDNQPLPALGNISFVSNSRTKRILRLQRRWQQLLDMKNRKRKIGGRKAVGLAPRRGLASLRNKHYLKKLHFNRTLRLLRLLRFCDMLMAVRMKAEKKLADLKKHGVLRKSHKLPRRPDSVVERSEAQQTAKLIRGADGHMQLLAVRRSRRKQEEIRMQSMAGRYEDASVTQPIPGVPTFSETHKVEGEEFLRQRPATRAAATDARGIDSLRLHVAAVLLPPSDDMSEGGGRGTTRDNTMGRAAGGVICSTFALRSFCRFSLAAATRTLSGLRFLNMPGEGAPAQ